MAHLSLSGGPLLVYPHGFYIIHPDMAMRLFLAFIDFLHKWWMKFAQLLGFINSHLILGLFYVIFVGVYSVVILTKRTLLREKNKASFWIEKDAVENKLESIERQF